MYDFIWNHSLTKTSSKRRMSAVFSDTHRVTWVTKYFFDSSIDIYTYNKSDTWAGYGIDKFDVKIITTDSK
jgi:hypothetical protein